MKRGENPLYPKLLKKQLRSGQISRHTYHQQKRAIVYQADRANWRSYLKFLKGGFYE